MTICPDCGRTEDNGRCGFCESMVINNARSHGYGKEDYMTTAAKIRRTYGDKQYQIFIDQYKIWQEAKKGGREAYEKYTANVLKDLSAALSDKARRLLYNLG